MKATCASKALPADPVALCDMIAQSIRSHLLAGLQVHFMQVYERLVIKYVHQQFEKGM